MATRLPTVGGDDGDWGTILNDFLDVSHNADGSLLTGALRQAGGVTVVNGKVATNGSVTLTAGDVSAQSATAAAGGDLSGSYPNPIVAKLNGVSVSGTPSSGQALVATGGSAASWDTVGGVTDWLNAVSYGADSTGSSDSTTAIQNAINALPTSGGVVYLPSGTYKVASTLTITGTFVYLRGDGRWATTLKFTGTGDCLRVYNTDTSGKLTGGGILDLSIDGVSAGAGSTGLHYGDMRAGELRLAVLNFSGSGSMGVHFDNQYSWTEECHGYLWFSNNTANLVFDVSGNTTSTNSFGYSDFDVEILAKQNQDGVVLQSGALYYNSRLAVRANFQGTPGTNTSAVLRITGTVPVGHPNAGNGSKLTNSQLAIQAECSNVLGANAPQSIVFGTLGTNALTGCVGILDFTMGNLAFVASNWTALGATGSFIFSGSIAGDFNLNNASVGTGSSRSISLQGAVSYGKSLLNVTNGNLSVDAGDFFSSTLTGSITINLNPGGGATLGAAQRKTVIIKQAASGGPFTVTWPSAGSPTVNNPTIVWAGGSAPVMSAAAGATDVYELVTYDGATWYGKANQATNVSTQADYAPTGLTGATASSRYVGATTSGAPTSGTFAVGDYVIDQTGSMWVCTTAGSPGTWVQLLSTSNNYDYNQNVTLGETCIPRVPGPGTGAVTVSQQVQLTFWTAIKTETVNHTGISTASTAAGATPTYCAMGIYTLNNDNSLTLVGQCANDTTLFASTFTYYTRSLTASFQKVQGQRYAHAVLVVSAATMPNFFGYNGTVAMASVAPTLGGKIVSQSTLPSSVTSGGWSSNSNMHLGSITP